MITYAATCTEKDDDVSIEFINGGTNGKAIHFHLQLKQPKSKHGGGVVPNFS